MTTGTRGGYCSCDLTVFPGIEATKAEDSGVYYVSGFSSRGFKVQGRYVTVTWHPKGPAADRAHFTVE